MSHWAATAFCFFALHMVTLLTCAGLGQRASPTRPPFAAVCPAESSWPVSATAVAGVALLTWRSCQRVTTRARLQARAACLTGTASVPAACQRAPPPAAERRRSIYTGPRPRHLRGLELREGVAQTAVRCARLRRSRVAPRWMPPRKPVALSTASGWQWLKQSQVYRARRTQKKQKQNLIFELDSFCRSIIFSCLSN